MKLHFSASQSLRTFGFAFVLATLGGCGGGSIDGTWAICQASTTTSTKVTFVFSETTVTHTEENFSGNATCTGASNGVSSSSTGTFVTSDSTVVSGASNLDITYTAGTKSGTQYFQIYTVSGSTLTLGNIDTTYTGLTVAARPVALATVGFAKQ